jgi:hypothetical protein
MVPFLPRASALPIKPNTIAPMCRLLALGDEVIE